VLDEVEDPSPARRPAAARRLRLRDADRHEQQHNETMLQLLRWSTATSSREPEERCTAPLPAEPGTIAIEAGEY
jgi:hypothetical protein